MQESVPSPHSLNTLLNLYRCQSREYAPFGLHHSEHRLLRMLLHGGLRKARQHVEGLRDVVASW